MHKIFRAVVAFSVASTGSILLADYVGVNPQSSWFDSGTEIISGIVAFSSPCSANDTACNPIIVNRGIFIVDGKRVSCIRPQGRDGTVVSFGVTNQGGTGNQRITRSFSLPVANIECQDGFQLQYPMSVGIYYNLDESHGYECVGPNQCKRVY